jgi:hypothetical protein
MEGEAVMHKMQRMHTRGSCAACLENVEGAPMIRGVFDLPILIFGSCITLFGDDGFGPEVEAAVPMACAWPWERIEGEA